MATNREDLLLVFSIRMQAAVKESQKTMAEIARETGAMPMSLATWFSGGGAPHAHMVVNLARSLGVTTDWLLGASDFGSTASLRATVKPSPYSFGDDER